MKPNHSSNQPDLRLSTVIPDRSACRPPGQPAVLALILSCFLQVGASAQSATNFDAGRIAPKPVERKTQAAKTPDPQSPAATVAIGPSRYVGKADLETYVQSLSSMFSIRTRDTDPFGQIQDPDAKPVIKPTVVKRRDRATPIQITPFAEIVGRIHVTGIKSGDRLFFVGTRSFKQGDRFPIDFRGRTLNVEIASVTSHQIDFRSLDNGEVASIKLNILPPGLTQGTSGISAPGMVPDKPNAPLQIEPSPNLNESSQN